MITKKPMLQKLSYLLAMRILVFSGFITLVISSYQLYSDYNKDVSGLMKNIDIVKKGYAQSLALAVWNFDEDQLKNLMKGILTLPGNAYLEVFDKKGKKIISDGNELFKGTVNSEISLTILEDKKIIEIGKAVLWITLEGPKERLWDRVGLVLVSQALKTFIVAAFIILLIQIMITRYLSDIAYYLNSLDKNKISSFSNIALEKNDIGDEIDVIKNSINDFGYALIESHMQLKDLNENLEKLVEQRTNKLEESQKEIINQNQQRQQLLHVLCHDLKNPIASGISLLELLNLNPQNSEKYIAKLHGQLVSGIEIIDLVRTMLAIKDGKETLELAPINLASALENSFNQLGSIIEKKQIKIVKNIQPQLTVKSEKISLVSSVLNNLITNAIKFSDHGASIEFNTTDLGEDVILSVRDHGIGMPESLSQVVFDPTKTTSRAGTDGEKGTGFGMPLVKEFVEKYGGTISVSSWEKSTHPIDHGTEVKISLKKAS